MNNENIERALDRIMLILAATCANSWGELDDVAKIRRLGNMGFSNVDIAKVLGLSTGAVKMAKHRSKKAGSTPSRRKRKLRK